MSYRDNYPVRLVGGRLALDFLNTADWSDTGDVVLEKIETMEDMTVWLEALGLSKAARPRSVSDVKAFRQQLRQLVLGGETDLTFLNTYFDYADRRPSPSMDRWPILTLVAHSAVALLSDPRERARVKLCPGRNCGWLFLDETKNARRKWCMMETCGNRAKAARNYAKRKQGQVSDD